MTFKIDQRVWVVPSQRHGVILESDAVTSKVYFGGGDVHHLANADLEADGPLPLDWTKPIYTIDGKGPIEMNVRGFGWTIDDTGRAMRCGWVDPSNKAYGTWWFEDGTPARPQSSCIYVINKEPEIMIDWNKPLYIKSVHGEPTNLGDRNARRGVKVLSTAARPPWPGYTDAIVTLSVEPNPGETPILIFRTLDNKVVPGDPIRCGNALVFANVPERKTIFGLISVDGGASLSEKRTPKDNIALTFVGRKLVDAEVLR